MSVTAHCKKLTIKATCLLSQLLFIVIKHLTVFTLNVQCVCLAAGRCTQAGDATDQWRNQPNAAAVYSTQWWSSASLGWLSWIVDVDKPFVEELSKQHNWSDLSPGYFGVTCQARSMLITQLVTVVAVLSATSDISQGRVASHTRCGGIFHDNATTNFLMIQMVGEF